MVAFKGNACTPAFYALLAIRIILVMHQFVFFLPQFVIGILFCSRSRRIIFIHLAFHLAELLVLRFTILFYFLKILHFNF